MLFRYGIDNLNFVIGILGGIQSGIGMHNLIEIDIM